MRTRVVLSGALAGINWALSVLESARYKGSTVGRRRRGGAGLCANCFSLLLLRIKCFN